MYALNIFSLSVASIIEYQKSVFNCYYCDPFQTNVAIPTYLQNRLGKRGIELKVT